MVKYSCVSLQAIGLINELNKLNSDTDTCKNRIDQKTNNGADMGRNHNGQFSFSGKSEKPFWQEIKNLNYIYQRCRDIFMLKFFLDLPIMQ
jgi:hypothetical protein